MGERLSQLVFASDGSWSGSFHKGITEKEATFTLSQEIDIRNRVAEGTGAKVNRSLRIIHANGGFGALPLFVLERLATGEER